MNTKKTWPTGDMPDLDGRVAVVTGANSGIGFETARKLAQANATVVMACRDLEKGETARRALQVEFPTAVLELQALDLADLESVHAFAANLATRRAALDLLINNAGVMALPYRKTADGFEMQFGINHLGHFALTGLLLDLLRSAPAARVVTVSSGIHHQGKINFEDLNSEQSYSKWGAYAQSKLANLLFAYELQRKLEASAADVISVAAHPGYAATNLQTAGAEMDGSRLQKWLMLLMNRTLAQSQAMGALPILYAAIAPDVNGGEYLGPDGFQEARGYPTRVQSSDRSHNLELAQRLWRVSEAMTGVTYDLRLPAAVVAV